MPSKKQIVAIMYDFDKTLSTTDMQNYAFIPNLGLTPEEFWGATTNFTEKEGVERILSYMYMMIAAAKEKGIKLTREYLNECGKNIKFYPGVTTWFERINQYGLERNVIVEHYLVSSGTKEIVEGCSIYKHFTKTYGCEYFYNDAGEPIWPKLAINFTQKTQFFYRIAKGAVDVTDDAGVNAKTAKLRVPYRNIIYMGDGMTDIPCMTLIKKSGGKSIALYPKGTDSEGVKKIYNDERVSFISEADYSAGGPIEKIIKLIIDSAVLQAEMDKTEEAFAAK
ncbi:MAG: haloacid dehalogenase-like hydrolase [Bacilli bacterium]|nr:haloacid dehalogenase-like hydrolase [Bacilli bacterium]